MKICFPIIATAALMLASCAVTQPPATQAPPAWTHAPNKGSALHPDWWKIYGDPALSKLIAQGWNANPDIEAALRRVEVAKADRFEAMAALFPKAGIAAGFSEGREQTRMTNYRPDDLAPWNASGELAWELDLFGKRRAAISSAKAAEAAAHARWRGVKLLVATEIAMARFEDLALSEEITIQSRLLASENKNVAMNEALFRQGLISTNERAASIASAEEASRMLSELDRQRGLARLRLNRLCGGSAGTFPASAMPRIPLSPTKSPASVWGSRPDLIAAEADVRSAFAAADAARLDLLPTLSLAAGGSLGSHSLTGQLRTWELTVGPRLEIPIWDPARIATTKRSKAKAAEAAANYRSTALRAVEEIESSYLSLEHLRSQLVSLEKQRTAAHTAWLHAQSLTREGQGSFSQENQATRHYQTTTRQATRLKLQLLNHHLTLIRALGG